MASQEKNQPTQEQELEEEKKLSKSISFYTMPSKFLVTEKESSKSKVIAFIIVIVLLVGGVGGGIFYLSWNISKQKAQVAVVPPVVTEQPEKVVLPKNEAPEEPEEQKSETPEEPEQQKPDFVVDYVDSRDTDQDGLTDLEETIFNTFTSRPDSDGDGHTDSKEILAFYNPSGLAPASLIESGLIQSFENNDYNYIIFYPSSWQVDTSDISGREVLFTTQVQGEEVKVTVEDNPGKKSISDWYIDKNPAVDPLEIKTFTQINGLRGVKSKNGLIMHLVKPEVAAITSPEEVTHVYTLEYLPGDRIELNYRTSFDMMMRSLTIVDVAPVEQDKLKSTAGQGVDQSLTPQVEQ